MNCERLRELLEAHVDGALGAQGDEAVRRHLEACSACAGLLAERLRLRRLVRETLDVSAPGELRAAVGALVDPAPAPPGPAQQPSRWWLPSRWGEGYLAPRPLFGAVAAAAAVAVALLVARERTPQQAEAPFSRPGAITVLRLAAPASTHDEPDGLILGDPVQHPEEER